MNFYNIFLRAMPGWESLSDTVFRAKNLGFDAFYINACFLTGESNSIYSIKDYYKLDPQSFHWGSDAGKELEKFLSLCKKAEMPVIMDLVINHTAIDNLLTGTHKNWYFLDEYGDIQHPLNVDSIEKERWVDSAWLNYEKADKSLWEYMLNMALHWLAQGFSGFRCDVANSVYVGFWRFLIDEVKKRRPDALFICETFACPPEKTVALAKAGFDYYFNSLKWWDFDAPWLLEQYNLLKGLISSISIPDNHDTERSMQELNGNIPQYLRRLYFTGFFAKGFMMTCGFEYGFKNKLNVCGTTGTDWENTGMDFTAEVAEMLRIKKRYAPLHEECDISIVYNNSTALGLLKSWKNEKLLIMMNKVGIRTYISLFIFNIILNSFGFESIVPRYGKLVLEPYQVQVYENGKGMIIETLQNNSI